MGVAGTIGGGGRGATLRAAADPDHQGGGPEGAMLPDTSAADAVAELELATHPRYVAPAGARACAVVGLQLPVSSGILASKGSIAPAAAAAALAALAPGNPAR